jgi:Domain of unknown function (DUF4062)
VGRLTVFVSSTIGDFAPLRRDLCTWLRGRHMDVLQSEDFAFPVTPGVHSHDACLRAVERAHVLVVLVGERFGGRYLETDQSITWREVAEAKRRDIPVIAVVTKSVNDEILRSTRQRQKVAEPLKDIARFISYLRKGDIDNWVHLEWDGSFTEVRKIVDARLNTLFVEYQRPWQKVVANARRLTTYAQARLDLDNWAAVSDTPDEHFAADLLTLVEAHREPLFGFGAADRYNFVVYRRSDDVLRVHARACHPDITRHDRAWRVGEGHVGLCASKGAGLVASNLAFTESWVAQYDSDDKHYVSLICEPIRDAASRQVAGVLTITSSRLEHFRRDEPVDSLTAKSLARMLEARQVL